MHSDEHLPNVYLSNCYYTCWVRSTVKWSAGTERSCLNLTKVKNARLAMSSLAKHSVIHTNVVETHCYVLQCRWIDCEQNYVAVSINNWLQDVSDAADKDLRGRNILQSDVDWYCYIIAHNQFTLFILTHVISFSHVCIHPSAASQWQVML